MTTATLAQLADAGDDAGMRPLATQHKQHGEEVLKEGVQGSESQADALDLAIKLSRRLFVDSPRLKHRPIETTYPLFLDRQPVLLEVSGTRQSVNYIISYAMSLDASTET